MSDARPIGIFDSGVGGLTVFKEISRLLPDEDILYFGDTARLPYGTKSRETIIRYSIECAEFLIGEGAKVVIVACNTASSVGLDVLRKVFKVPVVGVIEAGVREVLRVTRNKKIGLIGTRATIKSGAYKKSIARMEKNITVISRSCPLFVPLVEEGWIDDVITKEVTKRYLASLTASGIDTLILGCTHYPLLREVISEVVGEGVALVDSGREVARAARKLLLGRQMRCPRKKRPRYKFYVSDEPHRLRALSYRFIGKKINFVKRSPL